MFDLLNRIKDKAFQALSGAENAVGQVVHNFTTPQPQAPRVQAPQAPAPQQIDFGKVIGDFLNSVGNQPLFHNPNPFDTTPVKIPVIGSPTIKDAINTAADFTVRPLTRIGFEGAQSLSGDKNTYVPKPGIEQALFGKAPLQDYSNPNRPANQFSKSIGHPELAGPLIAAGGVLDIASLIPGVQELKLAKFADVAKATHTVEDFAKIIEADKGLFKTAQAIFKDAKVPINTMEDLYGAIKKTIPTVAPEVGSAVTPLVNDAVQKVAKTVAPEVAPVVAPVVADTTKAGVKKTADLFNPAAAGDIYKKKNSAQKLFEDAFRSSKGVIGRSGPAGKEIVSLLDNAGSEAANLAGEATAKLQTSLKTLNQNEIATFADVTEGKIPAVSQAQAAAVGVWDNIAKDVAARAKTAGIDMGIQPNYFPHQVLKLDNAQKQLLAQDMVNNGTAKTVGEALQSIETQVKTLSRTAERRFGNLELPRDANLPYNKSPKVLFNYVQGAYGRITDAKHFGTSDEKLYQLAHTTGSQGGDANQVTKYVDQILGKNQSTSGITKKLTSLQTITKLNPVTSVVNLTQNLSIWLRTDTPTMIKTFGRILDNPEAAFSNAIKVGENLPDMSKFLQDYAGSGNVAGKWIRLIGMQGTEKFNRVVAVNAGIEYGTKLAEQAAKGSEAAIRELSRFGIGLNDVKGGKLTDAALKKIGQHVSGATQFSTKAGELPYAWKTNAGKVATQFKSFSYKQTGFLKDEVVRIGAEAGKGNFKPLANALVVYGVAAPLVGEVVNDFRSVIRNNKRQDTGSLQERYISNILAATSFGLLDSTGGLLGQFGPQGIISAVGGPTVSDASKIVTGVADAAKGVQSYDPTQSVGANLDPNNTTQRALLKEVPAIGPTLSNTLVPNSYVDNYIGPNNGLNKANNQIYKDLLQTDPSKAEAFKQGNQQSDQKAQNGNILDSWFGGGKKPDTSGLDKLPTTKAARTVYDKRVNDLLAAGAVVPDKAIVNSFFNGKTYKNPDISDRKAILEKMLTVSNDQYLTPEQKTAIANASGVPQSDLQYYRFASLDPKERLQGLLLYAQGDHPDRDKLMTTLASNLKSVGGKAVANTDMFNYLYDQGLISKDEKKLLSNVKYDQIYDKFYMDRDYTGSGTGGLSTAKAKAYINSINSLNKSTISTKSKVVKAPAAPQAPRAIASIRRGGRSSGQWFNSY